MYRVKTTVNTARLLFLLPLYLLIALNISFPGVDGEALLVALDLEGIACSLGTTCASGSSEPAPILVAMGLPSDLYRSAVRFSLSFLNTREEMESAAKLIARVVSTLRKSK